MSIDDSNTAPPSYGTMPQPDPVANEHRPTWEVVIEACRDADNAAWVAMIADMEERHKKGVETYGVALKPFNGRDQLVDAYQELLDACVYIVANIQELGVSRLRDNVNRLSWRVVDLAHEVRQMILERDGR